jgi:nucleotide-binding universal stress UspA family protein
MKFTRLLSAVDFSEPSVQGFETAVALSRALAADLHVIHVIEAEPANPDIALQQKALAAMDALVAPVIEADGDLQINTEITTGSAAAEILDYAKIHKIELIVLGAKGLSLLEEALLGGTAKRLVSEAPCSVLAVRPA